MSHYTIAKWADKWFYSSSEAHGFTNNASVNNLARIQDGLGVNLLFKVLYSSGNRFSQYIFCFTGKIKACGIGPATMLFHDVHNGQSQNKDEVVVEAALVTGYKAKYYHFRLTFCTFPDDQTFFNTRLVHLSLNLRHDIAQFGEGYDHFCWHQTGAEALNKHNLEAVFPLML